MANYQVDADELFSDSDDGGPSARLPSPKRPRALPPKLSVPSLGPISLSSFGRGAPIPRPGGPAQSFPSFNPNANRSSFPSYGSRNDHRPSRGFDRNPMPHQRPSNMGNSSLGPMGRGRSATVPAHVKQRTVRPSVEDEALSGAASILPEHQRERFLQEQKKKREAVVIPERKRPGVRRKRQREPETSEAARTQLLNNVVSSRKNTSALGGLKSLMASAEPGRGLIKLDPERSRIHKPNKRTSVNVYAAISVTKESREREELERRSEALRKEEEARRLEEEYGSLRQRERMERIRMSERMKMEKTVASGMRDAYTMARVENHLFATSEDKENYESLESLGLRLHPVENDEETSKLLTVEVIQI